MAWVKEVYAESMHNTIEHQVKNWRSEIAVIHKLNDHCGYRGGGRTLLQQVEFAGRLKRLEEIVRGLDVLAGRKYTVPIGPKGLLVLASPIRN